MFRYCQINCPKYFLMHGLAPKTLFAKSSYFWQLTISACNIIKRYTCCFVVTVFCLSVRSYEHKKKIQILKRIPVWQGIMQFSVWHSHYVPSRHRCVVKESFLRSYMHDVRVTIKKLYDQYFVVIINCPFKPGYLVRLILVVN